MNAGHARPSRAARARSRRRGCRRRCGTGRPRGGAPRAATREPSRAGSPQCRPRRSPCPRSPPFTSSAIRARPRRRDCRGWVSTARELHRTPGLRFWRLLGTGRGATMTISADLRRWALFAVWEDEAALDAFLATSPIAARWDALARERWHVRLACVRSHGAWGGAEPARASRRDAAARGTGRDPHPRDVRPARLLRFYRAIEPPAARARGQPGPARVGRHRRVAGRPPGDVLAVALARRRAGLRLSLARARRGRAPHARRGLVLRGAVRALRALRLEPARGTASIRSPAARPAQRRTRAMRRSSGAQNARRARGVGALGRAVVVGRRVAHDAAAWPARASPCGRSCAPRACRRRGRSHRRARARASPRGCCAR